jgi:hypothetical protein
LPEPLTENGRRSTGARGVTASCLGPDVPAFGRPGP